MLDNLEHPHDSMHHKHEPQSSQTIGEVVVAQFQMSNKDEVNKLKKQKASLEKSQAEQIKLISETKEAANEKEK